MSIDQQPAEQYVSLDVDTYDAVAETKEQERKIRKRKLKKQKKKKLKETGGAGDSSDDEDNSMLLQDDEIVNYVTSTGDVYELRAFGDASQSKYDVKLHMVNERTFFKYLFSSFHLGGMGTFLLTKYSNVDKYKLILVGIIWLAAFSFILWGLQSFYHRRSLMRAGKVKTTEDLNPHGPAYIMAIFVLTFSLIIIYSIISEDFPKGKKLSTSNNHSIAPPITSFLPME